MKVTGGERLQQAFAQLGAAAPGAVTAGLYEWAEMVMGDSKENYVPVDTGMLRASGFVSIGSQVSGGGMVKAQASDIATRSRITVSNWMEATPTAAALEGRSDVSVILGYGGAAAPYALAVHENPRAGKTGGLGPVTFRSGVKSRKVLPTAVKYKHWARTGQWKFLSEPVQRHLSRASLFIGRALNRTIAQVRRAG